MFRKKKRSEFTRNVLTLMSGTAIAQALPIAVSPILTRIYSPDDFGVYALFMAITAILSSVATGRYESALILPEKDTDAINLAALSLCINGIVSFGLLIVVFFLSENISDLLGNKTIQPWLYIVPAIVFLLGLINVLTFFNTRTRHYKDIARSNIIKALILASIQTLSGYFTVGVIGLISGQFFSQLSANIRLMKNIISDYKISTVLSINRMIFLAKKHRSFPKYSLPAVFANSLSIYSVNILISTFFGITTLGFYSHVQKILGLPSILIGTSIGQVFYQEAGKERRDTGNAKKSFLSTLRKLLYITPVFLLIFFTVEDVFTFVFGEPWRITGEYAKILTPLFAIRFVSSSLSSIVSVFEKNKLSLLINVLLLAGSVGVLLFSTYFNISFKNTLVVMSITLSVMYFTFIFLYYQISKRGVSL